AMKLQKCSTWNITTVSYYPAKPRLSSAKHGPVVTLYLGSYPWSPNRGARSLPKKNRASFWHKSTTARRSAFSGGRHWWRHHGSGDRAGVRASREANPSG